jgi:hypothetical protein
MRRRCRPEARPLASAAPGTAALCLLCATILDQPHGDPSLAPTHRMARCPRAGPAAAPSASAAPASEGRRQRRRRGVAMSTHCPRGMASAASSSRPLIFRPQPFLPCEHQQPTHPADHCTHQVVKPRVHVDPVGIGVAAPGRVRRRERHAQEPIQPRARHHRREHLRNRGLGRGCGTGWGLSEPGRGAMRWGCQLGDRWPQGGW